VHHRLREAGGRASFDARLSAAEEHFQMQVCGHALHAGQQRVPYLCRTHPVAWCNSLMASGMRMAPCSGGAASHR